MTDFWIQESTFLSSFCSQPRTLTNHVHTHHSPTLHTKLTILHVQDGQGGRRIYSSPSLPNRLFPLIHSVYLCVYIPPLLTTSTLVSAPLLPSCRPSRHSLTLPPFQYRLVCPPLPIFACCTDPGPSSPVPLPLFLFFLYCSHDRRQQLPPPLSRPSWSFLPSQLESSIPQNPSLSHFTSCLSYLHKYLYIHRHTHRYTHRYTYR